MFGQRQLGKMPNISNHILMWLSVQRFIRKKEVGALTSRYAELLHVEAVEYGEDRL